MKTKLTSLLLLAALLLGVQAMPVKAAEPPTQSPATAFSLIKEGNRYIGEQAKDRVVQIRAEKSVGAITPNIWYVVYYDPTAALKAVEVKFAAGKMVSVERPLRILEPALGKSEPLDRSKLKIDSDEAINIAIKEPILANLKVVATAPKLEDSDMGPVWRVRLWVQKLRDPVADVNIGEVTISPETGMVIKADLHIDRAS
jgi:hypothetical protein